jgi:hypothetical protein
MRQMSGVGERISPHRAARGYYDAKYAVFQKMYEDQMAYRALMKGP